MAAAENKTSGPVAAHDTRPAPDAVVAGVDGSPHDEVVVRWAAAEAVSLDRSLHLQYVVSVEPTMLAGDPYLPVADLPDIVTQPAEQALQRAVDAGLPDQRPTTVTVGARSGSVTGVLVDLAREASVIVLGGGGRPGTRFLGSTALSVTAHAENPVVVLPDVLGTPRGEVVVGVDGSAHSVVAARHGIDFARRHGLSVLLLATWTTEIVDGAVVTTPGEPDWLVVQERYHEMATRVLDRAGGAEGVALEIEVRRGAPAATLLERAEGADLLVLGSRGRGGFTSMLLGSTTKRVLEGAGGPVAVVHARG